MKTPIQHFSDILCVFAYVADARVHQLQQTFPKEIDLKIHFCSVFGDTERKIHDGWGERGGAQGYNRHVLQIAERYPHVSVHPRVWLENPPKSSLAPHLLLRAIGVVEQQDEAERGCFEAACHAFRQAFFQEARNIGERATQGELLEQLRVDRSSVDRALSSGSAHAALASDLELARRQDVSVSPTLLFNEGRQRLNGNVGFRIIEANVREFLRKPLDEASWC